MSTLWTTVPLDKNANSIRIFTIDSDDGGDNLRCSFRTVQLSDEPLYTAISYTWHTPLGPRERSSENEPFVELGSFIICNGFQVQILDNLYWALRQLRTSSLPGVEFWADALCIDQSNVPERNHQVAAMAEIFQSAQNVVVWLGPSTSSVSRAVEFVELMSGLTAEAMQAFAYRTPCDDLDGHTRSKLMQRLLGIARNVLLSLMVHTSMDRPRDSSCSATQCHVWCPDGCLGQVAAGVGVPVALCSQLGATTPWLF